MTNGSNRATSGDFTGGSDSLGSEFEGEAEWMPVGERNPIYVVADNVRSLFNVGAIFRTADGVNAAGVYLTGFTGRPPRKEISRVALGAETSVPWRYRRDPIFVIEILRRRGVQVLALERGGHSVEFREVDYAFPLAIVVGHEVEGVRTETIAACTGAVHIPMLGSKTSLNVSVATGIILYHVLDQMRKS